MRALITGFTASMTTGRSAVGFESFSDMLLRALNNHDHQAIRQPMYVKSNPTDIAEADVLFIGIAPFNALGSRYIYGALDAMFEARKQGKPVIFYISDWQNHLLKTSIKSMQKSPEKFIREFSGTGKPLYQGRTDFEWAVENLPLLSSALDAFHSNPWPITLIPTHPWRQLDHKLTQDVPTRRAVHIDPTAFTTRIRPLPEPTSALDRAPEWVIATLGDYEWWTNKQGFQWPLTVYGGKTWKVDPVTKERTRHKRVKENEVNERYAKVWGGLAPEYRMSGSGWWRTRYDFILRSGAIVAGAEKEIGPIGEGFYKPFHEIEAMNTEELVAFQKHQVDTFKYEPEEQIVDTLVQVARDAWTELH